MPEIDIQHEVMLALTTPSSRLWRNNVGMAWQGKTRQQEGVERDRITLFYPRAIRFGLAEGSSDLIGITSVLITPEMVGRQMAVFTAIETKAKKKPTEQQVKFIDTVLGLGGFAGIARSVDDAVQIVTRITK